MPVVSLPLLEPGVSIGATKNKPVASWQGLLHHRRSLFKFEAETGVDEKWAARLHEEIWWAPSDFAQLDGRAEAKKLSDGGFVVSVIEFCLMSRSVCATDSSEPIEALLRERHTRVALPLGPERCIRAPRCKFYPKLRRPPSAQSAGIFQNLTGRDRVSRRVISFRRPYGPRR
jgi:hypothetical protein